MNNLAVIKTQPEDFESFVHISYNQVRTFLQCPQKYFYQYVRGMEWEFIPDYFPFGGAIHKAVEGFYRHFAENGEKLSLDIFLETFRKAWKLSLSEKIRFKETPEEMENKGTQLLEVFHNETRPGRIIGVEIPFSVEMTIPATGEILPCRLVGIFDLIETDQDGNPVVVELKTAKKRFSEDQLDLDFQPTLYGYALNQLGYSTMKNETLIRFDLLLKTKKPDLERYFTIRNGKHYLQAVTTIKKILRAIELEAFFPITGWHCSDCPFQKTCKQG
ncbi:MAG TPA: PD-(D/E)XK nuclease family protein [Thermodesulfobacteriota bacterium]|nr:PD-(D/E)XK nuclease family protein [Thermodesulfobacteriota bacterium]